MGVVLSVAESVIRLPGHLRVDRWLAVALRRLRRGRKWRRLTMERQLSSVEERIDRKLRKRAENAPNDMRTLNSVLMKLGKMQKGFEQCRETFIAVDTTKNNMISYDELRAAVEILGYKGTEEDLQLIFKHSDIDGSEGLSFRQFLITLLFLNILRDDDTVTTSPEVQRSFDIVTDAFLFFDKDRTGLLKLDEVLNGSYERKEGLPDGMVHVFEEMNTDGSGCVNLSEFVYALESWAGVDEQETSLLKGSAAFVEKALQERAKHNTSTIRSSNAFLLKVPLLKQGFEKVRKVFDEVDTKRTGGVDYEELVTGARKLGYQADESTLRSIFLYSDLKEEGELQFRQFVISLVYLTVLEPYVADSMDIEVFSSFECVLDAFQFFDKSGEGKLDAAEFVNGFRDKSGDIMMKTFMEMDYDQTGELSLSEFLYAVMDWADLE